MGISSFKGKIEVTNRYIEFINILMNLIPDGISAAIYTQTTDVESEINGIMTYDRNDTKVLGIIKDYHERLIATLSK